MLLRNRSRAVTKPGLMADHTSHRQNYCATSAPIPSLFGSPKFRELSTKCVCASGFEAFTLRTPTSILDSRALNQLSLSPIGFSHQPIPISSKGLALLTSLQIQQNSNVLFGTQLGVKIPTPPSSKEGQSVMCWSEMENCEEYTCVKSRGPNPTTTHIFHNCIILIHTTPHHNTYSSSDSASTTTTNFLTFCYTCKIHLDHTKDIFIYRGEKAFCSEECRYREMVLDGEEESSEFDSNVHASSL